MPDLEDIRRAGEADVESAIAKLDGSTRRKLRSAIQRYGSVREIPQGVWDEIEGDTAAALLLLLLGISTNADKWTTDEIRGQGGKTRRDATGLAGLAKSAAGYATDSQARADELSRRITQTTRDRLSRRIEDAKLDTSRTDLGDLDLGDIDKALDDVLSKERRDGIATDGTTGAISAGQRGAADRVNGPGNLGDTIVDLVWETEQDNRVCPRCSPLNGTTEDVWGKVFPNGPGPEAHPNCRCSLVPRVRAREEADTV